MRGVRPDKPPPHFLARGGGHIYRLSSKAGAGLFTMITALTISGIIWTIMIWFAMKYPPKEEESERRTRAGEAENRFPEDELLRGRDWRILERPKRGPDKWVHVTGMVATFDEALALVMEHEKSRPHEYK